MKPEVKGDTNSTIIITGLICDRDNCHEKPIQTAKKILTPF